MKNDISTFIAHARSKGMDHQTIRMILLSTGWKERDIAEALATEGLSMPVPTPPDTGSARDAFYHLLNFTSLYSFVISSIILFFTYITLALPDRTIEGMDYGYMLSSSQGTIRWGIAVVIVSYPLLLWMSRLLARDMQQHPEKKVSGVRRWLTYLTLFVTACVLIGDLITLIFTLLEGELTLRFILKVFIVLVFCGAPFSYYFLSLRGAPFTQRTLDRLMFWKSLAVVLIALVWGFMIAGGPATGRMQKADEQRVSDLRTIQNEVYNIVYGANRWSQPTDSRLPRALPKTLDEIAKNATSVRVNTTDPETGESYEYSVRTTTSFELCATFAQVRSAQYDIFWDHPAGRHCFTFNALEPQGK